ncbi:MAG: ribonucleoside-diphosphate reductase beta chain [Planctomycetota bacterium]|jgi:ribonucleoside-diphosphate reductase beta chain
MCSKRKELNFFSLNITHYSLPIILMSLLGKPNPADFNLHPEHYPWARELYDQAVANTWYPHEIPLKEDLDDFETMTEDEQHAIKFVMAFFNPSELIVNRVLALGVYPYIKSAECHLYLAKQMWEEANHCVAFEYVLETFPFDREKIYNTHLEVPSMKAKEDYIADYLDRMTQQNYDIETVEGKKEFIRNLVAYNIVMEGVWFYSGFMVMLSFQQRNKLKNFGSMINWVLRDESLHLKFGLNLLLTSLEENPDLMTSEFAEEIRKIVIDGVELEVAYNKDLFPKGILGLNADYVNQYVKHMADRRLEELGLEPHYGVSNPAKWMSTATDVYELVNFFESQNTSYEVNAKGSGDDEVVPAKTAA